MKKSRIQVKKNKPSKFIFMDSRISRNIRDERKLSCEFLKTMRFKKVLRENFESGFIKSLKKRNNCDVNTDLSMIADCGSSNKCFDDFWSIDDKSAFITSSLDSGSNVITSNIEVNEYVKNINSSSKNYVTRSYDNLLFKFKKRSIENETKLRKIDKSTRAYSQEDLNSYLDRKISELNENEQNKSIENTIKLNYKKTNSVREGKKKSFKRTFKLVDNVNDITSSVKKKSVKRSLRRRMSKLINMLFCLSCSSDNNDKVRKIKYNLSSFEEPSNFETENIKTICKVSTRQNVGECSTSCHSNVHIDNNLNISLMKRFNTPSSYFPIHKWFTGNSGQFHNQGDIFINFFKVNDHPSRHFVDIPDNSKFADFSRAYYPLTKWTLINRLFRQKTLSGCSPIEKKTARGDEKMEFPIKRAFGSLREGTPGEGSKTEVIPVSLTDVKIEDPVKVNGEKRSQDDDEDECGSGWGYWLEYLMVLFVSVILLLGCVFLVLFWCFYYKKGYNSWKVERDQQFNLHPTLMVGAVVFTGFSVLMYRIGRCSRRLYVKLLHATFHLLAILCFVGGFLSIFEWHNMTSLTHFYSLHSWIGFITMGLFGIQFLVGFVSFLVLLCCESATAGFRACLLPLHTTFGLTIFLISIATCLTGLVQRTNSTIGEENYPSLPEEAIVVNALGVALVAVGVAVTYALGRTSLRVKSDCYISERL